MDEGFDYLAAVELIRQLVPRDDSVDKKMRTLIAACEADYPHAGFQMKQDERLDGTGRL